MRDYEKNKRVKIKFSLRDEFGNWYKYKTNEKLNPEFESLNVFYMIKAFKRFLISAGYTKEIVENITYKGITEDQEEEIAI